MRSRYTAHVMLEDEYLHRTYLGTARKPYVEENEPADITWTGLTVHAHEVGPKPDVAYVDFTARFDDEGAARAIHEKSEFQRIGGTWFYTRAVRSGPAPVKSSAPKVGRNEPCPCGSGKKYKHCCGK